MQRDYGSSRDAEHLKHSLESAVGTLGAGVGTGLGVGVGVGVGSGLEASTMGLLSASGNEVLHYTFRPSKQIVSIWEWEWELANGHVLTLCFNLCLPLPSFCFFSPSNPRYSTPRSRRAMLLSIRRASPRAARHRDP